MKKYSSLVSILVLVLVCMGYAKCYANDVEVSIIPCWQPLGQKASSRPEFFGGEWVLVAKIILKKRIKDTISLCRLDLKWEGGHVENLIASLYHDIPDKKFLPTQPFLLADGIWNKKMQRLQFKFNCQEHLNSHTVLYLVFTVPEELKEVLRDGFFSIVGDTLPVQMQSSLTNSHVKVTCMVPDCNKLT